VQRTCLYKPEVRHESALNLQVFDPADQITQRGMELFDDRCAGAVIRLGHQNIHLKAIERADQPHNGLHSTLSGRSSRDKEFQIIEEIRAHRLDVLQHGGQIAELSLQMLEGLRHGKFGSLTVEFTHCVALLLLQSGNRAQCLLQLLFQFLDRLADGTLLFLSPRIEFRRWHDLAITHRRHAESHRRTKYRDVPGGGLFAERSEGALIFCLDRLLYAAAAFLVVITFEDRRK
jgi:hypothetical protein